MSELRLFEPCPADLQGRSSGDAPPELCSDPACGLRSDHPGDRHARISIQGTVLAIWPAVELSEPRAAALAELLAASLALVQAAEYAETVATDIRTTHGDDPILHRLTTRFLSRLPRWDYLPVTVSRRPGREWREILEDAARSLGRTDWSTQ